MGEQENIKVVQDAYAAFGRNDVPGLLNHMTEDIDWHMFGPQELPTGGPRKGKPEVSRFFKEVGETWNFEKFEPRQFIAQGDMVVALGFYSGTAKSNGRTFGSEFAHVFTVRNGKVVKFREYTDTANLVSALSGSTKRV
jgi:ketosteroid isomerase-like protein